MKSLRVLWTSNSPVVYSGYGVQTDLFTRQMLKAGHEPIAFAFYGHRHGIMNIDGIKILPPGLDLWGQDMIARYMEAYNPDVSLILCDAWVYDSNLLRSLPLTLYAPIDHDPIPPKVAEKLGCVRHVWAMSRHGERAMRRIGLDPYYVPHGVDTSVYKPMDRTDARRKWQVEDGWFYASMVAANKGYPARKNFERVLKAWSIFVQKHPKSRLYLHTLPTDQQGGLNLAEIAAFYEIPGECLSFPDLMQFHRGDHGPEQMALMYNAADVLLCPSNGGGFEVPIIEAAACGCPSITTNFTAMSDFDGVGYLIDVDPIDEQIITNQYSEQAIVPPSKILKALEWAYEQRGNDVLRRGVHEFAQEYAIDHVYKRYAEPALYSMAEMNADLRRSA